MINYIFYKKNINMVPSKVAYEVLRTSQAAGLTIHDRVTVLGVSTKRFNALVSDYYDVATIREDPENTVGGSPVTTAVCIPSKGVLNIKL